MREKRIFRDQRWTSQMGMVFMDWNLVGVLLIGWYAPCAGGHVDRLISAKHGSVCRVKTTHLRTILVDHMALFGFQYGRLPPLNMLKFPAGE